jgi:aminopeptidase N
MKLGVLLLSLVAVAAAVPSIDEILGDRPSPDDRPMSAACRQRYVGAVDAESLHSYNVRHYRVDIDLPMTDRSYTARAGVSIMSEAPAILACTLHFVNLVCDSVKRSGVPLLFTTPTGLLAVDLDSPLGLGDSTVLDIFYRRESTAPERGYYFARQGTTTYAYAMTCTPPKDCRYWMPCWDEPFDKPERGVMLNITVPDTFQACANGLLDSVTAGSGTRTYWWSHRYPIATYLINFAASRFATWKHDLVQPNGDTVPSSYFMWPPDSAISVSTFGRIPEMFGFYSDTSMFGPYPFEKYGQVPGYYSFPWGAMENQTLTMIHTQWLRQGDDPGMAHELSHMWYGDMVTCVDFRNIWLNEGFATYFECLYYGHANGRAAFNNYVAGKGRSAISQDRARRFPVFNPPESEIYNYGTIYCKGAWVEHTLRWVLGDTAWESPGVFFQALRAYGDSFKYGCASTEDYRRINERASGRDLSWFFDEWVYQAGYPKYHLNWSSEPVGGENRIVTSLSQTNGTGAPDFFRTPLPVRIKCAGGFDTTVVLNPAANPQVDTFFCTPNPESLKVDPDNWVLDSAYVVNTGVEEGSKPQAAGFKPEPTVVRGVLFLAEASSHKPQATNLLDAAGRRVLSLKPGRNDVSHLAPGIYFVRSVSPEPSAVSCQRVVLSK